MPQTVDIPGQGIAQFPDDMTPDDIKGVIDKKFFAQTPSLPTQEITPNPSIGEIAQHAGTAAVETAKGFIPKSLGEVLGFVTPVVGATEDIGRGYGMLKDVLFGKPIKEATAENFPETQIIPQAEQTTPYSEERFQAGFGALSQLGMAALGVKGLSKTLSPEAFPQIPETPISDVVQQPTGGIDAIQEQSTSSVLQHPQETVTETGGQRERVEPSVQRQETPQASAQEVAPTTTGKDIAGFFKTAKNAATDSYIDNIWSKVQDGKPIQRIAPLENALREAQKSGQIKTRQDVARIFKEQLESAAPKEVAPSVPQPEQPTPISEPTEAATVQPLTQDLGVETSPTVSETTPKGQAEQPIPNSPTSLKNAVVDQEREARGLPSAITPARQGFGELWDRVSQKIDQNQNYPDEVIQSLKDKSRAMTDEEDAALLHRQVDLQNQYSKVNEDVINAQKSGDETALSDASAKANALSDQLLEIYDIGKKGGTETGRGLAARKLLAQEDFSLANMITQKRAALMGKELSPEETGQVNQAFRRINSAQTAYDAYETSPKAEAYRKRLKTMAEDYRTRTAKGDFTQKPRNKLLLDTEGQKLKADAERAKADWQRAVVKDRYTNRTPSQKFWDNFVGIERSFKLSSDVVLAKLTAAAGVRELGLTPLEQAVGSVTSKIIPGIARKAPRYGSGFSLDAEVNAKREMFTTGMKDAWQNLKMKNSDLDELYKTGKIKAPEEFYDYMGYLHGALKAPIKRAEFARSLTHRMKWAAEHGQDLNNQSVMRQLSEQAYIDANRSIFLQDNIVSKGFNMVNKWLETQKVNPAAGQTLSRINRFLIPIVKVPSNIVGEVAEGVHGVASGGYKAAKAYVQGVNNLEPARADLIMRQINKGLIGNALILTGYLLRDKIGGFYHDQDKRTPQDVQPGRYRVGGFDLPASAGHSTGAMLLNIGATIGRVADEKVKKTGSEVKGTVEGLRAAGAGLAHEIPFVPAATNVIDAMDSKGGFTKYINNMITSTTTPAIFSHVAKVIDTPGTFPKNMFNEATKRKPTTPVEALKMGIPGLRQTVPEKSEKVSEGPR